VELFSIKDKVAVITGASGVLGGSVARSFVKAGAKVVALGTKEDKITATAEALRREGGEVLAFAGNVLDVPRLEEIADEVMRQWGRIDILLNIAGGNLPGATLMPEQRFFDMDLKDWNRVTDLNMNGTVYPSYVFGKRMAATGEGSIINISSMAAMQAMTRVPGYSAAKAAVANFTQWMAMEMAMKYDGKIRVNAVAPGFFIGEQNRAVLLNSDGSYTERSHKVIANTPMRRFGEITELDGAVQFLCSPSASFITGVIIPVDGGFSMFSGV